MDMLEKIARVLLEDEWGGDVQWDTLGDFERQAFKDAARAVLTALLEPTPEMIEAGSSGEFIEYNHDFEEQFVDAHDVFQAMIRKALGE